MKSSHAYNNDTSHADANNKMHADYSIAINKANKELHNAIMPLTPLQRYPSVSVIITNYNYSNYIGQAIESVTNQDYNNYQIVVCDDGSSDGSCEIIKEYVKADSRIVFITKENGGHASAINRAFTECSGDIISILDADDLFTKDKLTKVVNAFTHNTECGIAIHDLKIVDGEGRKQRTVHFKQEGYIGPSIATLRMGLPMPQASGLSFRREVLHEILPLPEERFRSAADWAIAYAAAFLTKTKLIPEVLGSYRIHGNNLSGTTSDATKLQEKMVGKNLAGIERVIDFVDKFMRTKYGIPVHASRVRNVIEHRLILGLLSGNKELIKSSSKYLCDAYSQVRMDYPFWRYYFWQSLAITPLVMSKWILLVAFQCYRMLARLKQQIDNLFSILCSKLMQRNI